MGKEAPGSWRCSQCGQLEEHCKGHRWGGKEGVKAPVKVRRIYDALMGWVDLI